MHRLALAFLVAVIAAGSVAPAAQADPAADLAAAREKWAARDARDYSFRLAVQCFCPREVVTPTTMRVVRGKPRSTPKALRPYDTAAELFALVEKALASADVVNVSYARNTGLPTSIEVDQFRMAADDELSIKITRIRAPR